MTTLRFVATTMLAAIILTGCTTRPKANSYNVEVDGAALGGTTVSVHLIGGDSSWAHRSMADYWRTDNPMRQRYKETGLSLIHI